MGNIKVPIIILGNLVEETIIVIEVESEVSEGVGVMIWVSNDEISNKVIRKPISIVSRITILVMITKNSPNQKRCVVD